MKRLLRALPAALLPAIAFGGALIRESPFGGGAGGTTAAAAAPLEYIGYLQTAEGIRFRLFDPARQTGVFVKLDEPAAELNAVARRYDSDQETLTVEFGGRLLQLPERKPKVRSSAAAPRPLTHYAAPNVPTVHRDVITTVAVNPTAKQEMERLTSIQAELERRRLLRERAQQEAGLPKK